MPQKIFFPLAFPQNLGAAQGPVLVVDGVFDGKRVFIREESDAGLRFGCIMEHAAVSDALTVRGDGSRGEICDETLAVAFVQAAGSPATAVVRPTGAWIERRREK